MDSKIVILAEPVLVGRERELGQLQQHLADAVSGKGGAVFVSGEAGSGKTRLANEFLNIVKKSSLTVLSGWCLSNAAVPYFPFVEAFDSFMSSNEDESKTFGSQHLGVKTWLAGPNQNGGLERHEVLNPQAWKDQAFAAVTKELLLLSTSKPMVLFIDDLHWADSASLALLHYIARAITSERVLVIATFRSEEINANLEGQQHSLAEVLRLMGREGLYKEIKLQNLSRVDVGRIAENMLGGSLNSGFVGKLADESHGSPLFVVESLRMMYSQGSLVQECGQWRLTDGNMGIPAKVKDVILRRLDALKPNQRRILNVASVIGEKFDPKLVAAVFSQDSLNVLESISDVAQSTQLVFCEGNSYRFNHAKIREMLYNEISPLLKKEYHLRIADSLEGNGQNVEALQLSDIAYHYAQAGNNRKAVKYFLAAGKDALAKWSNAEAIKHFTFVLQTVSSSSEYTDERRIALEGLGDAYYANCMFEDAIRTYEELANSETGSVKLRAMRKEMGAVWYKEMEPVRLMELVKKSEGYAVADRLESARVRWNRGRALLWLGDVKSALNDHEEALRVFEEEYALFDVAYLLWGTGVTRVMFGSLEDKGLCEILRGIAMLQELGDFRGEILAWRNAGVDVFLTCGLFQEAYANLANIFRIGEKIGDFISLSYAWWRLSDVSETSGNFIEAISHCLKALEYSKKTDAIEMQCKIYVKLAKLYALCGNVETAEEYFNKLVRIPEEIRLHPRNCIDIAGSASVFFAIKNQWIEANQTFKQATEFATKMYATSHGIKVWLKTTSSILLDIQGKAEAAKIEREEANKITETIGKKYEHTNAQAHLMARREVLEGEEFEMRFDVVNVGRKSGLLIKIGEALPSDFKVVAMPSYCHISDGSIELQDIKADPFKVEVIKLRVKASRPGTFKLKPCLLFVDDLGETKTYKLELVNIDVKPTSSTTKAENVVENTSAKLEFKSEAAQKAFDFLVKAFLEDNVQRKLLSEKSGWRTLMDIVKQGQVSKYSVYGSATHRGLAVSELERSGLVETRMFEGERGRGGKILKLRVAYEKEKVKRHVDQYGIATAKSLGKIAE